MTPLVAALLAVVAVPLGSVPAQAAWTTTASAPTSVARTGDAAAVDDSARAVAEVEAALADAAAAAAAALEAYQGAARASSAARSQEVLQHLLAGDADRSARSSRDAVGAWARWSYIRAGGAGELAAALDVLQDATPSSAASSLLALRNVSLTRTDDAERAARVQRAAALTRARAEASSALAAAAATRAQALRERSEQLVAGQRARLDQLQALLDADLEARRRREEQQRRAAEQERLVELAALQQAATAGGPAAWGEDGHAGAGRASGAMPAGACAGGDVAAYPNGLLPTSALCPLWGASGQLLRADAAAAFGSLSQSFAAAFGTPLCVTDSYRPLADQVRLARTKPQLAARPGTSEHGWGVAVDLCGGVQRFDSVQHAWLRLNAPLTGWFHPSWARADGSRPEPWHWEFAG